MSESIICMTSISSLMVSYGLEFGLSCWLFHETERNTLSVVAGWNTLKMSVRYIWLMILFINLYTYLISADGPVKCWQRSIKFPKFNNIYFLFLVILSVFPHILMPRFQINTSNNCYVVLETWSLYYYAISVFIPVLKCPLSGSNVASEHLFWIVQWDIFYHSFTFNCVLMFKVSFL